MDYRKQRKIFNRCNVFVSRRSSSYSWTTNTGSSSISQALDVAVEAGIVTVVAIGNGNLGIAAHPGSASYPGDSEKAITVGSVNDDHNREIYSSRGPTGDGRLKPDVMAPGGAIMSASAGSGDGYVSYSGTSMATPHVAGVAAIDASSKS